VGGCTIDPFTGRPTAVLTTVDDERRLGAAAAGELGETIGYVDAPRTVAYVRAVGARLTAGLPGNDFEYHFNVLDMVAANALALPGGHVYVTRGLLVLLDSEDELASVIGHEIVHVAARHSGQRLARAAPVSLVSGIGALATGIVSPRVGRAVAGAGDAAGAALLAPYSRSDEREADREGQRLAATAGWDPLALAAFLETLERDDRLRHGDGDRRGFLASHPSMPERVDAARAHGAEIERASRRSLAADRADFLGYLDGLTIGESAASGVFEGRRFLHPDLGFALEFPPRWIMHNARRFVAAQSPDGAALVALEFAVVGDDPVAAAHAFGEVAGVAFESEPQARRLGSLAAAHATAVVPTRGGGAALDLTWVAHRDVVYRITGVTTPAGAAARRADFAAISSSFRELTAAERDSITETRLRVRRARDGESVNELTARTGSAWSADEVAIANGLAVTTRLADGRPVKVAIRERY